MLQKASDQSAKVVSTESKQEAMQRAQEIFNDPSLCPDGEARRLLDEINSKLAFRSQVEKQIGQLQTAYTQAQGVINYLTDNMVNVLMSQEEESDGART